MDLSAQVPRGIVLKYYLYMGTLSQGFITPVLILVMLFQGLTYTQIGIAAGVFRAAWLLSETPAGYVGDRIGRRGSLLISTVISAVAIAGFGFARSFVEFVLVYGLWGIGITFRTGSLSAWLYEMLEEQFDENEYARITGRGTSIILVLTAIQSVLGGHLYDVDRVLPFLINGALVATGGLVLVTLPRAIGRQEDADDQITVLEAAGIVREKFTSRPLRSFVVYAALFYAVLETAGTFIQPVSVEIGIEPSQLGWLYAVLTGAAALASFYSGDIKDRIGIRQWFAATPFVVGGLFMIAAAVPLLAIPAFVVMRSVNRVTGPLRSQYLNDNLTTLGRATALSTVSMVNSVGTILAGLAAGVVADYVGPIRTVGVLGVALVVGSLLIRAWEMPVTSGEETPSR